jgi:hypothetical protein
MIAQRTRGAGLICALEPLCAFQTARAKGLPELAAATCIWRDFFTWPTEIYTEDYAYIKDCLEN